MSNLVLNVRAGGNDLLCQGIARIQEEQHVTPQFPAEVVAAAEAASRAPRLPTLDLTGIEFVTIDPEGSMDLDQAMHLARQGDGYLVHYAIANLPAFITAGDPIDLEANKRGESLYGADSKIPLHPTELSEGAASLLPDQVAPAYVWSIELDGAGEIVSAKVEQALVRSRAKLDYGGAQKQIDDGSASESLQLLKTIGELRIAIEAKRGGISLPRPEQEIVIEGERWSLEFRGLLPTENWNAQISLLTGFAAAKIMIDGKVGILRTLPPPEQQAVDRLRRKAKALGVDWPGEVDYPELIRGLDPAQPKEAALIVASTSLLRGAGYLTFNGTVPEQTQHAALAADYAHVTAPLRRLIDRYGLEICAALCAGEPVPSWVLDRLPDLPATMQESGRRAHAYENAVLDLVEAMMLRDRVGETFRGVVLDVDRDGVGQFQIQQPAIEAPITGEGLPVGEEIDATLTVADPVGRKVAFVRARH